MIVGLTLSTVGHILIVWNDEQTLWHCAILLYPLFYTATGYLVKSSLISIYRLVISIQIARQKVVKDSLTKASTHLAILGHCFFFTIMQVLLHSLDFNPQAVACENYSGPYKTKDGRTNVPLVIIIIYQVVWMIAGLISDIGLVIFVKKQNNKVAPIGVRLEVWKSVSKYDPGVPIRATILSTVSLVLFLGSFFLFGFLSQGSLQDILGKYDIQSSRKR